MPGRVGSSGNRAETRRAAMAETRHSGRTWLGRRKAVQLGPSARRPKWWHRESRHRPASSWVGCCCPVGEATTPRRKGGWMRRKEVAGTAVWERQRDTGNEAAQIGTTYLIVATTILIQPRCSCRGAKMVSGRPVGSVETWTSYRVIHEVSWGRLVAAGDFWAGDWSESAGRAVLNASWRAVGNWEDGSLGRRSGRRLVGNRVWSRGGPDNESYLLFLGK